MPAPDAEPVPVLPYHAAPRLLPGSTILAGFLVWGGLTVPFWLSLELLHRWLEWSKVAFGEKLTAYGEDIVILTRWDNWFAPAVTALITLVLLRWTRRKPIWILALAALVAGWGLLALSLTLVWLSTFNMEILITQARSSSQL